MSFKFTASTSLFVLNILYSRHQKTERLKDRNPLHELFYTPQIFIIKHKSLFLNHSERTAGIFCALKVWILRRSVVSLHWVVLYKPSVVYFTSTWWLTKTLKKSSGHSWFRGDIIDFALKKWGFFRSIKIFYFLCH